MKKFVFRSALFLLLLLLSTTNPRQLLADGTCTDPSFPRSECALSNPGGCVQHGICIGGLTTHYCCPAIGGGSGTQGWQPEECDAYTAGGDDETYRGVRTALGCLPSHPRSFIDIIIGILFGAGAGIALLLMIIGAGFVLTSQGQPERVQRGKEVFTSALVGLLFMLGAVFILTIIGVDILGIFRY